MMDIMMPKYDVVHQTFVDIQCL